MSPLRVWRQNKSNRKQEIFHKEHLRNFITKQKLYCKVGKETSVLHLLPLPIKLLVWRETEKISVKLLLCLHFHAPDDSLMQRFPNGSIVTYLWFWCCLWLCRYPLFLSFGIPGGDGTSASWPTLAFSQMNKKYCVFGKKLLSFLP